MNILRQKYERKHEAQKKSKVKDKFAGIITRYERHLMAWAQIILRDEQLKISMSVNVLR